MSQRPRDAEQPADRDRVVRRADEIDWPRFEELVHGDPLGRGLASYRCDAQPLDAGQLRAAAIDLACGARAVGIVTGFCMVTGHGVTAETDGPPGALYLARALRALDVEVSLISDAYGAPLLAAGRDLLNLDATLVECPIPRESLDDAPNLEAWIERFFEGRAGGQLSHLVSIERPGPSHTLTSLQEQARTTSAPLARFEAAVAASHRDVCHNMRGQSVDALTAPTHRLFEWITSHRLPITTIGIGDGGNEIGMGSYRWETLVEAIRSDVAGRIACRIATDFSLLGGTSDWPAYALALAVTRLRGAKESARPWTAASQRALIEDLVAHGAVDGVTLRAKATVDGLPLDRYLAPLVEMRALLGFADDD